MKSVENYNSSSAIENIIFIDIFFFEKLHET